MATILHTINKSPFTHSVLKQCLDRVDTNDCIILLEDGVYGALSTHPYSKQLIHTTCYAIEQDIAARGLDKHLLLSHIQLIDYQTFVTLTINNSLIQRWD